LSSASARRFSSSIVPAPASTPTCRFAHTGSAVPCLIAHLASYAHHIDFVLTARHTPRSFRMPLPRLAPPPPTPPTSFPSAPALDSIAPPASASARMTTTSQIDCHRGRGGWRCGDRPPCDDRAGSPPPEKSTEVKGKGRARADVEQNNKRKKAKETDDEPAEAEKGQGDAQPPRKRVKPDGSTDAGPSAPLTRTRAKREGATSTQNAAGAPKPKPRARRKQRSARVGVEGKEIIDGVLLIREVSKSKLR
ncbi:hypothetical protein B0H13DRAFT_2422868, partial [Mycena leptocephala]